MSAKSESHRSSLLAASALLGMPAIRVTRPRSDTNEFGVRTLHFPNYQLKSVLSDSQQVTVRPYTSQAAHKFKIGEQALANFGNAETGSLPMDIVITHDTVLHDLRTTSKMDCLAMGFEDLTSFWQALRLHYPSLTITLDSTVATIRFERGFDVGGPIHV